MHLIQTHFAFQYNFFSETKTLVDKRLESIILESII